jgi:outer membrane protein assembly factor BamD (BamD/ComL family)
MRKGIRYNQAAALLKDGQNDQAKAIFSHWRLQRQRPDGRKLQQSTLMTMRKRYMTMAIMNRERCFYFAWSVFGCKGYVLKCQNYIDYNKAVNLMKSGDKAGAEKLFISLGSFKDSEELALDCKYSADYEKAKTLMGQGNFTEAVKLLEPAASADYKDSKILLADCKKGPTASIQNNNADASANENTYKQAVAAYNSENYYTAYNLFGKILNYKDAMHYYDLCAQTPSSTILYQNENYTQNECQISIEARLQRNIM